MDANETGGYATRLAERGLVVQSFDGHTLTLNYNPAADRQVAEGKAVSGDQLTVFAQHVLGDLPGENRMFPGLERIRVDFTQL